MISIPQIQYITRYDTQLSHFEQAELMFRKGVEWVQIRMKNSPDEDCLRTCYDAVNLANQLGTKLIVNDSVEIAKEIKAHGVHLGLKDEPIDIARSVLGEQMIIGGTANTIDDIKKQVQRGADYIGLGPFRFTTTKKNLSPVIGLSGYKELMERIKQSGIQIPLIAVGGIEMSDIQEILDIGLSGVAISGSLLKEYRNQ